MITAKLKKLGNKQEFQVKINLPEAYLSLFNNLNVEIVEMDDIHTIYIVDQNKVDILAYTIHNFKNVENVKYGFQKIIEKLNYLLKDKNES